MTDSSPITPDTYDQISTGHQAYHQAGSCCFASTFGSDVMKSLARLAPQDTSVGSPRYTTAQPDLCTSDNLQTYQPLAIRIIRFMELLPRLRPAAGNSGLTGATDRGPQNSSSPPKC